MHQRHCLFTIFFVSIPFIAHFFSINWFDIDIPLNFLRQMRDHYNISTQQSDSFFTIVFFLKNNHHVPINKRAKNRILT